MFQENLPVGIQSIKDKQSIKYKIINAKDIVSTKALKQLKRNEKTPIFILTGTAMGQR